VLESSEEGIFDTKVRTFRAEEATLAENQGRTSSFGGERRRDEAPFFMDAGCLRVLFVDL